MLPARQTSSLAQCKGTLFVNLKAYVERDNGVVGWRNLIEGSPPRDREVLEGLVLVGGWYPIGVWNRTVARLLSRAQDPAREMGEVARFVADHDLNTLHKALLRMGSPKFVLQRSDTLWRRYFDVGEFSQREVGVRHWQLALEAPVGEDVGPDEYTCNQGVSGWMTHALQLTGAREGVVTHVRCRHHGASRCEYEARW